MATKDTKNTITKKTSAKKAPVKKASAKAKKEVIEAVDAVEDAVETAVGSVLSKVNKNVEQAQNLAKQVWFAYLGAAGRTVEEVTTRATKVSDELQARYTKMNKEGQELVGDLITRGEKVQDQAKDRLTSIVDIQARLQDVSSKFSSLRKDLKKSA